MFYEYFVFIKKVTKNYLTSFITERAHYLTIIKLDVIDLKLFLISQIDSYKHLILKI